MDQLLETTCLQSINRSGRCAMEGTTEGQFAPNSEYQRDVWIMRATPRCNDRPHRKTMDLLGRSLEATKVESASPQGQKSYPLLRCPPQAPCTRKPLRITSLRNARLQPPQNHILAQNYGEGGTGQQLPIHRSLLSHRALTFALAGFHFRLSTVDFFQSPVTAAARARQSGPTAPPPL